MKLFTVEQANELISVVEPILKKIRTKHGKIALFNEQAKAAASSAQYGGGGMEGGSNYVDLLVELGNLTAELDKLGVQLKDYSRGLIDFPCRKDGRVVLLCWQLGEGDNIEWWHDIEAGFAGRQRI